jgi:hypothetical protein
MVGFPAGHPTPFEYLARATQGLRRESMRCATKQRSGTEEGKCTWAGAYPARSFSIPVQEEEHCA